MRFVGIAAKILPMTDDFVPTTIVTDKGEIAYQDFLENITSPKAFFAGEMPAGKMTKEVETALEECSFRRDGPSNPISSIGPILNVNGMRKSLKTICHCV